MRHLLSFFLFLLLTPTARATTVSPEDSIRVVTLLAEGARQSDTTNLMLFYGRKFIGTPYVAATLEVNAEEELVVNLHGLDCTTFVETVLALTLTTREGRTTFADYCRNLERIRYRDGRRDGYPSRNHYFSWWISSNTRQGIVREISGTQAPFSATMRLDLHYMSQHPDAYPMLKGHPERQALIRTYEQETNTETVRYIPKTLAGDDLPMIEDGDILALTTKKDGLDTSHLGLAVWGDDGRLHLLNASMIYHKVVLDTHTLYDYQQRQTSQTGLRVVRLQEAPIVPHGGM